MSASPSAARFEAGAANVSDNNAGDNSAGSRALANEAYNDPTTFKSSELAKATQDLVNNNALPGLQIDFSTMGDKQAGLNQMQMMGDKRIGLNSMQTVGDKQVSLNPMQTMGDKKLALNQGQTTGDKISEISSQRKPTAKELTETKDQITQTAFDKGIRSEDLNSMNKSLEERDPNYDNEVDSLAETIGRDGSFGNDAQGEANRAALEKHLENGTLDEFVNDINDKLAKANSPYRVSASQFKERMKYREDAGEKTKVPSETTRDNNRANITVTNTKTGRSYTNRVAPNPSIPNYNLAGPDEHQL